MRGGGLPDDRAVVGPAEHHLGGLRGRIDASDKHWRLPSRAGRVEVTTHDVELTTHDNAARPGRGGQAAINW
jgi:hypothetical protein